MIAIEVTAEAASSTDHFGKPIEEKYTMRTFVMRVVATMVFCSAAHAEDMRRVVTGLDERNHAVVLFDSRMPLNSVAPGIVATNFWITDTYPPNLSKQDPSARLIGTAPPDNGTKFRVVEFAPLDAATEAKMPADMIMKGITNAPAKGVPVTHPLMHRTRSLDYAVILSGEIDMMLDDSSVHLKQGDVIVQQATNHAWINRGTQPCRILFVLMDSKVP
jgi:mannose-6-phosphate isomerase-like protein (cupin superfamily)